MDPAESQGPPSNVERILSELTNQATTIQHHDRILAEILQRLNSLVLPQNPPSQEVLELPTPPTIFPQPQPIPAVPLLEPRLPPPERYDGNTRGCRGFITQCALAFQLQPSSFPTESSRVAYIITLLTGRALEWATALLEHCSPFTSDSEQFLAEMRRVFHHPGGGVGNDQRLLQLTQGARSVAEMAIEFRTLAAESGWNTQALQAAFHQSLSPELKDELAFRDPAPNLDALIDVAIRVDNRVGDRRSEKQQDRVTAQSYVSPVQPAFQPLSTEEPMQLGKNRLSQSERDKRMRERRRLYCGELGHFRSHCPELVGKEISRPERGGLRREK